jgi:hypothetical protein
MDFNVEAIFSLTAGAAALIGWVRIKKTNPAYLPFTILLTAGFITEVISLIVTTNGYSNALFYNVFALAEACLVTHLYYRLGLFRSRKWLLGLQFFFIIFWICESFYHGNLSSFYSYFLIVYSTILVLLSIHLLHSVVFQTSSRLYRNPVFLISMGFIVYFTYTILVELFWFYGLNQTPDFRNRIYDVFSYINLFTNILFILATLWIPLKRQYILRSSLAVS